MIFRKSSRAPILDIDFHCRENGAQNGHCRSKIKFFAVAMETEYRIADSGLSRMPSVLMHVPTKFHRSPAMRLACSLPTNKQTHKPGGDEDPRTDCVRSPERSLATMRWRGQRHTSHGCVDVNPFVFMNQHENADIQMGEGQNPGAHRFLSSRVARGKFWNYIEEFWRHFYCQIFWPTERYHWYACAVDSHRARVALKNMCSWNTWKMTKFPPGYHGNVSTNPLLAHDAVAQQGAVHDQAIIGAISLCSSLWETKNIDFHAKIKTLNSQFPEFAKWQPYILGQKPKHIFRSRNVAIKRKKNEPPRCKTDRWMAWWTAWILDDFGRCLAEIISFSPLAPKLLEIEIQRNVIKCSTC